MYVCMHVYIYIYIYIYIVELRVQRLLPLHQLADLYNNNKNNSPSIKHATHTPYKIQRTFLLCIL